jgi:prophage regulatory protein
MQYYRMKDLVKMLSVSRDTIIRMIKSGNFPQPVRIGKRAIGFDSIEVNDWMQQRQEERQP